MGSKLVRATVVQPRLYNKLRRQLFRQTIRPRKPGSRLIPYASIAGESGKTFDLNGYVRAQNLNGWARVSISWFDNNAQYLGSSISNDITATNSSAWELVSITDSVPPSSAAFFQVFAQMYSSDPSTSVWFDEITNLVHHLYLPSIQK